MGSGHRHARDEVPGAARHDRPPGEHRTLHGASYDQLSGIVRRRLPTKVFEIVHAAINIFAVARDGRSISSLHPALYREWLIALFPPIHRDLVRDVLADLADSLRAYIVGQLLDDDLPRRDHGARSVSCSTFRSGCRSESSPGSSRSCRSSARCCRRRCPRCSCSTGHGYHGFSPLGHALLVVGLGVVVHLIEGNIVSPLVMSKKVDLPPVLTIMSVLVIGQLLGGSGPDRRAADARRGDGDRAPHPHHAHLRRPGFRRTTRERPLVLRVPVPGGGVIVRPGRRVDVVTAAERAGVRSESAVEIAVHGDRRGRVVSIAMAIALEARGVDKSSRRQRIVRRVDPGPP